MILRRACAAAAVDGDGRRARGDDLGLAVDEYADVVVAVAAAAAGDACDLNGGLRQK